MPQLEPATRRRTSGLAPLLAASFDVERAFGLLAAIGGEREREPLAIVGTAT